jgi:hypothetical protein
MKLKIQFAAETRFTVPNRKAFPTRMAKLLGNPFSLRSPARAERPEPWKPHVD